MTNKQKSLVVTLTIDVNAPEAVAALTSTVHTAGWSLLTSVHGKDSATKHAIDIKGMNIKTFSERLAENTATLHTHGKLIETVVEIAWNMALARFRPNDSYEFLNLAKDWAAEFEALYDDRVASCEWNEDAWRERCEHFTQEKVGEVVLAGLGQIVASDVP